MRGKLITLLARLGKGPKHRPPLLEYARMTEDGSVQIHGDGFGVHYTADERLTDRLVPLAWLATMGKQAGPRGDVSFSGTPSERTRTVARIKTSTYKVHGADAWEDFQDIYPLSTPIGARVEMSVADWSDGGAVAAVLPTASTDATRPNLHGVYLGLQVAATNGHALARRAPRAFMPALSGVLPLHAVHAMLKLVAETAPTALVAHVEEENGQLDRAIVFAATCPHGVTWTLSSRLYPDFPDCDAVVAAAEGGETLVDVEAADLRDLWHPLRSSRVITLAVYKDGGVLVWGDEEAGIGTTLTSRPTDRPAVVLGSATLPALAKRLPRRGRITIRGGSDHSCLVLGEIVMQMRHEHLPAHVELLLDATFG